MRSANTLSSPVNRASFTGAKSRNVAACFGLSCTLLLCSCQTFPASLAPIPGPGLGEAIGRAALVGASLYVTALAECDCTEVELLASAGKTVEMGSDYHCDESQLPGPSARYRIVGFAPDVTSESNAVETVRGCKEDQPTAAELCELMNQFWGACNPWMDPKPHRAAAYLADRASDGDQLIRLEYIVGTTARTTLKLTCVSTSVVDASNVQFVEE